MFEDEDVIICRLCLSSCYCGIDIFDPKGHNGLLLWRILKELLQLDVSTDDGLPGMICKKCMNKLTEFKFFKTMCIKSGIEFLKAMTKRGLVGGDAGAGLPFPKTTIGSRPKQPVVNILNVIEIPEDRDPLDFLIDEKAVLEEKCATVKPKKSSNSAISNLGHKDEAECIVVDEEDGAAEGIETDGLSSEDDDIAVISEEVEVKMEEDGVCSEDGEMSAEGTAADSEELLEFGGLKGWQNHARCAHGGEKAGEGVASWGCPFCDHSAASRKLLSAHVSAQHKERQHVVALDVKGANVGRKRNKIVKAMDPSSKEVSDVRSQIPTDDKLIECRVSLTSLGSFATPGAKKGAKTTQGKALPSRKESIREESTSSNKDVRVLDSVDDKICNMCLRMFTDENLLSDHVKQVHGLNKCYMCQKCSKSFKSRHQFLRHCEVHRSNKELMYWCSKCKETYSSATVTIQHIKKHHGSVKPVICKVCMCGYRSQLALDQHTCRLFGHMFCCPNCGKVFRHKPNCKRHVKICKRLQEQKK